VVKAETASTFGIVCFGQTSVVCLDGEGEAEGDTDDRIGIDPESRAHRDAGIVRATCWAFAERDRGDRGRRGGRPDPPDYEERFSGAQSMYPEALAGYPEGGLDGAVAALWRCVDLPVPACGGHVPAPPRTS
jgi:hypothetical protein